MRGAVHNIDLTARDLARSAAFYEEALGCLKHFDHVTVAVTDPAAAIGFFALLGFELDKDVVIKGPVMDQYMGIAGLEARHITLAAEGRHAAARGAAPAFPQAAGEAEGDIARLDRIGFNHSASPSPTSTP